MLRMNCFLDEPFSAQLISEHWSWNSANSLQSTVRSNLNELRPLFWVDCYLAYLTTTNFCDQPMFESGNICDIGLLQNARTRGPSKAVKTIEKHILHRAQVLYFCSGNSNQGAFFITLISSQDFKTLIKWNLNPKSLLTMGEAPNPNPAFNSKISLTMGEAFQTLTNFQSSIWKVQALTLNGPWQSLVEASSPSLGNLMPQSWFLLAF